MDSSGKATTENGLLRQGWSVIAASWIIHFCCLGIIYSAGVYFLPVARSFDQGRGAAAWMGSLWLAVMLMSSFGHSLLALRSLRGTFVFGGVLAGVGLAVTSVMPSIWGIYGTCVVVGSGLGIVILAPMVIQPWFVKHRGLATGIAMSGSGVGNFVFATLLQMIMDSYDNGKNCEIDECTAYFVKVPKKKPRASTARFAIPAGRRAPFDQKTSSKLNKPEVTRMDCDTSSNEVAIPNTAFPINDTTASSYTEAPKFIVENLGRKITLKSVAWTPCMRGLMMYYFFGSFGYANIFIHIIPSAEDYNISGSRAALLLGFLGLSSVLGRLLLGLAADRFGRLNMLKISMFTMSLTMALWPVAASFSDFSAIAWVYGFFAGGFPSLPPTIIADYYDMEYKKFQFRLMALNCQVQISGAVLGPPIAGWLYDIYGNYDASAAFTASALLLGTGSLFLIPGKVNHDIYLDRLDRKQMQYLGHQDIHVHDNSDREASSAEPNTACESYV